MRPMPIQPISITLSSPADASRLLHAPALHGSLFDETEDHAFDNEPDGHDREQAGEHIGGVEQVAVLENVPAQAAASGGDAEYQLRCDQRAPGKGPANFQPR